MMDSFMRNNKASQRYNIDARERISRLSSLSRSLSTLKQSTFAALQKSAMPRVGLAKGRGGGRELQR